MHTLVCVHEAPQTLEWSTDKLSIYKWTQIVEKLNAEASLDQKFLPCHPEKVFKTARYIGGCLSTFDTCSSTTLSVNGTELTSTLSLWCLHHVTRFLCKIPTNPKQKNPF